jgi:penicillin-binding protein 2
VVENSGRFGGTYAAPIVGLMIEKYLNDSISGKARQARLEQLSNLNLMPPRIFAELRKQDSMRHSKDSAYLLAKGYIKIIKDTVGLDDETVDKDEIEAYKKEPANPATPVKDTMRRPEAILPKENEITAPKDSLRK